MYGYAGTAADYAFAAPYVQEKDAGGYSPARRSRSNGGCTRFVLLLLLTFIIVSILVAATVAIVASYLSERHSGEEGADDVRLDLDHTQPTTDMALKVIQLFARKRSHVYEIGDHESFSRSPAQRRNGVHENRVDSAPLDDRPLPESRRKRKQSANADSRAHARGTVVAPSGNGRSEVARRRAPDYLEPDNSDRPLPESRKKRKQSAKADSRAHSRGTVVAPSWNGRSEVARRGAPDYLEPHNSEKELRYFVPHQYSDDTVQNSPLQPIDNKLELAPAQSSSAAIENLKSSGHSASPSLLGQGDVKQSQETNPSPENNAAKGTQLKNAAASSQEEGDLNAANES